MVAESLLLTSGDPHEKRAVPSGTWVPSRFMLI